MTRPMCQADGIIFTRAVGEDDAANMRRTLLASGNLTQPYHSINTNVGKRIRYL